MADLKGVTNVARAASAFFPFVVLTGRCGVLPIGVVGRTNADDNWVDDATCGATGRLSGVDEPEVDGGWVDSNGCIEAGLRSGVKVLEVAEC